MVSLRLSINWITNATCKYQFCFLLVKDRDWFISVLPMGQSCAVSDSISPSFQGCFYVFKHKFLKKLQFCNGYFFLFKSKSLALAPSLGNFWSRFSINIYLQPSLIFKVAYHMYNVRVFFKSAEKFSFIDSSPLLLANKAEILASIKAFFCYLLKRQDETKGTQ